VRLTTGQGGTIRIKAERSVRSSGEMRGRILIFGSAAVISYNGMLTGGCKALGSKRLMYGPRTGQALTPAAVATIKGSIEEKCGGLLRLVRDYSMINRLIALPLVMLGAVVFVSSAHAQARGAFSSAPAGRTGMALSGRQGGRTTIVRVQRSRRSSTGSGFLPYLYSDYDSGPETSEAPPQTVEPTAQPAPAVPVSKPGLVLELQGDHWVRLTNYGELQSGEQSSQRALEPGSKPSSVPAANPHRTRAVEPAVALPPAVLVFRDGHEEEIRKYTIVGATIYTSSDYWSSGSWTRKVQIVDLDVPATLKLNQRRSAKFTLPSGPNEVVMRP
jgi:hypothetical protein